MVLVAVDEMVLHSFVADHKIHPVSYSCSYVNSSILYCILLPILFLHINTLHYSHYPLFTRDSIYAIARICYGNSVCLSVCHTGGSVKNG